jgi:hypothetical protein
MEDIIDFANDLKSPRAVVVVVVVEVGALELEIQIRSQR